MCSTPIPLPPHVKAAATSTPVPPHVKAAATPAPHPPLVKAAAPRRKRTHDYEPLGAPGILVEYTYHPGARCQPIPGIGPEPAYVEIETTTVGGKDIAKWLASHGFDEESLADEILRQHPE